MGLDTSHNCWHGPYSAFTGWRTRIAEAAGYCVCSVRYDDGHVRDTVMIEWHRYREGKELQGEWIQTPHDPLIVLIAHSDCDGVIHPAQARPLADRLEELLPKLSTDDGRWSDHAKAVQFIAGLRAAVAANEDVDFH